MCFVYVRALREGGGGGGRVESPHFTNRKLNLNLSSII